MKVSSSAEHKEGIKLPLLPLLSRTTHIIQLTTAGEKTRSSQEVDRTTVGCLFRRYKASSESNWWFSNPHRNRTQ